MAKNIVKYHSIYLFISILTLIGFITGLCYYKVQNDSIKQNIKESINIEKDLSSGTNNILKRTKSSVNILINSFLIITQLSNISNVFIKPFEIGFISSFLSTYNFKLSIIYTTIYHIIPLLFSLILTRISITISINIIKLLIKRDKKTFKHLKLIFLKYILITSFLLIYEINFKIRIFNSISVVVFLC